MLIPMLCIQHLHTLCQDAFLLSLMEAWGNTAAATTTVSAQRDLSCLMLLSSGGPGGVWEVTLMNP